MRREEKLMNNHDEMCVRERDSYIHDEMCEREREIFMRRGTGRRKTHEYS